MSLRVQTSYDVTRSESTAQVFRSSTKAPELPKIDAETSVDRLWKDEGKKEENKNGLEKVEIESAVESINDAMEHINRALRFSIHEDTQRVMVKVVNIRTDEVIKELPPEDVLDTVARIREMIGLLIDERA
ncbi:MAG: flagellar protein FlaG [Firmicutes bacterium]|jgi:flagellar protein FlaG|nr:flagellar protein FlaG [Bacillota bacterium]